MRASRHFRFFKLRVPQKQHGQAASVLKLACMLCCAVHLCAFDGMGTGEVKWRPELGDVTGVCRVLFDEPLQQEETRRFARAELEKLQTNLSNTWNYDFVNDVPLEGRYEWTRLSNSDPEEYAASRKDSAISCSPLHLKARENAISSLSAEKQPKLTEFIVRKRKASSNGKAIQRPEPTKLTRRASS